MRVQALANVEQIEFVAKQYSHDVYVHNFSSGAASLSFEPSGQMRESQAWQWQT